MLYNDVRPHTFDAVVGQTAIVKNIRMQSIKDNFFSTYIFSGQYGTGKTTMARILAMAATCKHKDTDGNPCCECEDCRSILDKTAIDFVEVDGASNTGVDKVRELIQDTTFNTVHLSKKIICIDEVHMLSNSAFNALLKTLEEPPENVMFILCTTELRKIPDTVKSRAACYTFTRIDVSDISEHLCKVCENRNIKYNMDGIELIARRCDGSMRNALSVLEQAGNNVTKEGVVELLGIVNTDILVSVLKNILSNNISAAVSTVNDLSNYGDLSSIVADISDILKDVILAKMCAVNDAGEYASSVQSISELADVNCLVRLSDVLNKVREQFRAGYGKQTLLLELIKFSVKDELYESVVALKKEIEVLRSGNCVAAHVDVRDVCDPEPEIAVCDEQVDSTDMKAEVLNSMDVEVNEKSTEVIESTEVTESTESTEKIDEASNDSVTDNVPGGAEDEDSEPEINDGDMSFDFGGFDFFNGFAGVFNNSNMEQTEDIVKSEPSTEQVTENKTVCESVSEDVAVQAERELENAATENDALRKALEGCVIDKTNKGLVIKTPLLPILKIINASIDAYNISHIEIKFDAGIRL